MWPEPYTLDSGPEWWAELVHCKYLFRTGDGYERMTCETHPEFYIYFPPGQVRSLTDLMPAMEQHWAAMRVQVAPL